MSSDEHCACGQVTLRARGLLQNRRPEGLVDRLDDRIQAAQGLLVPGPVLADQIHRRRRVCVLHPADEVQRVRLRVVRRNSGPVLLLPLIGAEQDDADFGHVRRKGLAKCQVDRAGAVADETREELLTQRRWIGAFGRRADSRADRR